MSPLRYRRTSVRTALDITKEEKHIKRDLGITAILKPFRWWGDEKRTIKRDVVDNVSKRRRLLESTIRLHYGRRRRVKSSAVDSTGMECTAASGYFVKRRHHVSEPWKSVVYHRYPKLGVVCDTSCHFILSIRVGRGPRPDVDELVPLLTSAVRTMLIDCLSADAGYDSEANHRFAREQCGVRTLIPAKHGRPTKKPASGRYRRLMQTRFDEAKHHRRVQVEAVISMIKRRQGAHARGRTYQAQCRDLRLMALTHNIMILLRVEVFY